MCGIAGIFNMRGAAPVSLELVERMVGALGHRGPDSSGVYLDDRVGLGHARLSIIDLSGGSQPIHNEDETLWIVFNGEIFNYPELREDLERSGHRFYTSTDTEVIIHLFEEHGPGCLKLLNGQFAFAIWDTVKEELFLARDRFGILPLHYTVQGGRLLFASEVKSIFMSDDVPREIDPVALDQIFTFWTTLPGRTAFKGIQELPPGHCMEAGRGGVTVRKYWEAPFHPAGAEAGMSYEDACCELSGLIRDAVRIRLRADVPVGCYLSGGLDSSGITTLVRRHFKNELRTFGIRFEEEAFDERSHQDFMVSFLGSDHTALDAGNEGIGGSFRDVLWHCEKPLLRTAPVPLYMLSRVVRENGFKVVLTGEGADEVFGGYNIFRETKVRRFWARQPASSTRPMLIRRLYPYIFEGNPRAGQFVQAFFGSGLEAVDDPLYSHRIRWRNTARVKTFFSEALAAETAGYSCSDELTGLLPESFGGLDYLSKAQYLETTVFMSSYLLAAQGDRVSMAHAVEVRPPYLDHRIAEFMGRVPAHWKIRGLDEKHMLKDVFRGLLPDRILKRPKHPYRAPIKECLLGGRDGYAAEMLSDGSIGKAGIFDRRKVGLLLKKLSAPGHAGEVDGMALAGVLSTQSIYDQFIDSFPKNAAGRVTPDLLVDRRRASSGRRGAGAGRGA